ncbi:hypothetical protein FQR65_LT03585 [Abscondita terminalis]|nr:hypothetical protein FQR65_LT03585 [Abscondita terminalis]
MLSDKVDVDVNSDFEDNNNYKSCFARSVVVNSQYQHEQQLKRQLRNKGIDENRGDSFQSRASALFVPETNNYRRTRDYYGTDDFASLNLGDSRRSSACSSRIAEMPVENLVLRNQIETLQWQLKQTESSKEMYRELMVQVVKFLERAYRSLQILGSKVSTPQSVVRTQSDYLMNQTFDSSMDTRRSTVPAIDSHFDYTSFRDFTWRRQKKPDDSIEEVPPAKLSQEAFRLLRTAQSLLNTRAPDLAQVSNDASEDIQFLEQLAKEFPRVQESTHRAGSRCSSLQLGASDKDLRISTAFNRKLVLQQNGPKRNSFHMEMLSSLHLSDDLTNTNGNYLNKSLTLDGNKNRRFKLELEKSSPPMSSVSSAEDESGFSSMNSFQEIGIPLINSTLVEEELTKDKSPCTKTTKSKTKDLKLWQTPSNGKSPTNHKRWNSTPVENSLTEKPLKVLWV